MEVSGQIYASGALPPLGKEPPVPLWIGGWVGPRDYFTGNCVILMAVGGDK